MWVSRPIYESLPYFYIVSGALTLLASMYLSHWYWPTICFFVGLCSLVGGLVVLLKRRDYRQDDRSKRASFGEDPESLK
jgi:Flp pilus assembly protein TadB